MVSLSVRPSVARWYCIEASHAIITKSSSSASSINHCSFQRVHREIRTEYSKWGYRIMVVLGKTWVKFYYYSPDVATKQYHCCHSRVSEVSQ